MIYVIDDDTDVLGSLRFLLETDGFDVRTFRSAAALLNGTVSGEADCFVIENIEEKAAAAGIRHVLLKPHIEENLVSRIRIAILEGQQVGH